VVTPPAAAPHTATAASRPGPAAVPAAKSLPWISANALSQLEAGTLAGPSPANATPLPVPAGLPPAKAAAWIAADQARQRAAERAPRLPQGTPAPAQYHGGVLGLRDGGPFTPSQFVGTNLWNGPVGGRWMGVQAGGVPIAGGAEAAVYVYTEPLDPTAPAPPRVLGIFRPAGGPAGRLSVQDMKGDTLSLALAGSSTVYHFDVGSLTFVG
jgi:hypothetical protein